MCWTRPRYSIAPSLQTHFASSVSGDSLSRSSWARSTAPWVRKLGYLCIQEILVLTKSCAARTIIFQRENLNYLIVCFTQCKLFFKKFVFIADLFAVRYLSVVCNEAKCMSLGLFTFVRIACLLQLWIKTKELDYSIWAPPKLKNMKCYSGGEKLVATKIKISGSNTCSISSLKCATRTFLEVSRCSRAKQWQRNVQKLVCFAVLIAFTI